MLKKEIIDNMMNIVDSCMGDSEAACIATCPMHTDVKKYIKLIGENKGKEAIKVIREKLFIPGTLGRICAHPCETQCKWNENKMPMAIASLKRYAADNFDKEEEWDLSIEEIKNKKVGIIGAGPAGLQAALDLRKEGFDITIFEKLPVKGGMMAVGIPEYRLPRNVLEKEIAYLEKLGIKFELNCEIGKDREFEEICDEFDSVIIAVGKHIGRIDMNLCNVSTKGVFSAADFLREAALTRNVVGIGKKVLVVGGGDVAIDCCRVAKRIQNVEDVSSICLEESFEKMAASEHEIKGAIKENISINHAKAIKEIKIDKNGCVSGVILKRCISMFNEAGEFAPEFDEKDIVEISVDTIIFAIGQAVDSNFAKENLEVRKNSTFECDRNTLQSTKNEKIFIAGDASGESVIVIQAMATGRRAAESVKRFLEGKSLTEDRKIEETWTYRTKLDIPTDWNKIKEEREIMNELDKEKRNSFEEISLGYTHEEAIKEARRCRQCKCRKCMTECLMLREFTDCPKSLFGEYLKNGYEKMDKMIAYSCNQCNQCTIVCPKDLNIKDNFIAMKETFAEENKGYAPLKQLEYVAPQQEEEAGEKYSTTLRAKHNKAKKTKYVFVPGCTVPAYTPDACDKVLNHLKETLGEENVGAILQCCGKVSLLIGEKQRYSDINKKVIDQFDEMGAEVIITICPSCYTVYSETAKNQKVISYWDLMKEEIGIPKEVSGIGKNSDVVFNIHDSCATRNIISHHKSIRWILDEMQYKWEEIQYNGINTRCCGVGGMACSSNPELYERLYKRRALDFENESIVTYCGSCRGTMEAAGKDSIHILDLLYLEESYTKDKRVKERGYKDTEDMWKRRLLTKAKFDAYKK